MANRIPVGVATDPRLLKDSRLTHPPTQEAVQPNHVLPQTIRTTFNSTKPYSFLILIFFSIIVDTQFILVSGAQNGD